MPWFLAEYEPHPVSPIKLDDTGVGKYSSYLWARDWNDAKRIAKQRRVGEIVVGLISIKASGAPYMKPSLMLKKGMSSKQKLDFVHATCWLSFLAQASIGLSVFDVVGDAGILHEAIHTASHGRPNHREMKEMLKSIERKVPGYWPKSGIAQ